MLCERCGTDNKEGTVVCIQCYYAVGVPYGASGKASKGGQKIPAWAAEMSLNEFEARPIASQLGDTLKGQVLAYWFASRDDASETQKALQDTIGKDIQAKKVKVGVFPIRDRTALFIAGKLEDSDMVGMVCESFNGQQALGGAAK